MRTARAKRLSRRPRISRHALPNALLPVITLSGVLLGFVLAGSIPVERAFGTPGLGYAMFTAVTERDVFVMQNLVFLYSVVFVLLNIVVDLTIAWLDRKDLAINDRCRSWKPGWRSASRRPWQGRRGCGGLAGPSAPCGRRSPLAAFWGCVATAIIAMTVLAPVVAPYDPIKSDFRAMSKPPSERHVFGTDQLGRDNLSRVIYAARASLTVAFGAVLFGTTLGALWGLASGYLGGRFDLISQRMIEFLQSFPDLILAMAIAMALGAGFGTVIVAIAVTRIPFGGRVIRAVVLSLKEMSYARQRARSAPRNCASCCGTSCPNAWRPI